MTSQQLIDKLSRGESICLIFGLGPKGVPKNIHEIAKAHLDISERDMSLETCTAMGAVSAVIAHGVRQSTR